jgi:hypothetical protein
MIKIVHWHTCVVKLVRILWDISNIKSHMIMTKMLIEINLRD